MYEIHFYRNEKGEVPVKEFIEDLQHRNGKDARINLSKVDDYFQILSRLGTSAGEPIMKALGDGIWELRPIRNRIFFVSWHNDKFIMLHQFLKKTQKTPKREIEKAKREYKDLQMRNDYE